ncbi:MAG: hypothetical protein K6B43_10005 [Treponema sp.]|nr:hypothetical protein [Treponema sp.]
MKLSKKVLAAMSAATLIMTAGIFTSCGEEEADDENGMISGSNNDYTLSYDNSASTTTSRAYVPTKKNHRGALCQITLNKFDSGSGAAMGLIWDLGSTDAAASAEDVARAVSEKPRNLCIAAFANFGGTYKAYVSRYTNVYDIQADNFGTKGDVKVNGEVQTAVEEEYIKSSDNKALTADDNGNYVMTVNVYEETTEKAVDGSDETETWYTGGYVVDIYNGLVTEADLESETPPSTLATTRIDADTLGYTESKKTTLGGHAVDQKQCAVYANVYSKSKATGTWKYLDTYSADEVVED